MAIADKDAAQARVDAARRALDDDLATLSDRLPAAGVVAQAGAAGGIGLALLGAATKQLQKKLSQRSDEKALTREAEIQARAIAAAIAAANLGGGAAAPSTPSKPRKAARPTVEVPVPPPSRERDGDDDGPPWGILILLAALVAAVVAVIGGTKDDADLWDTPGA